MKPLPPPPLIPKRIFDLLACVMIVALALGMTYPWITQPLATSIGDADAATGVPGTDFMRSLAFSGWLHFAPTSLHEWPLAHTRYLMYPAGASHGVSFDGLLLAIFVALMHVALPLQLAWSIALVLAFVLSGLMTYRFGYRRFGRGGIALMLAASATCLPYIRQRAPYHPNLCYVWVMPLAIHLALNFLDRPTRKRALAWSLSFPLLALSSSYVLIAGLCFQACATLALMLEWKAWRFWRDARLQALMLGWIAGIAGVILVLLPMVLNVRGRDLIDPDDLARYSVPLVQYLMPHQESWLFRKGPFPRWQDAIGTPWEACAGGPVAAILLAPLFVLMRRVPGPRPVLGIALLGLLLLCSGPGLKLLHAAPLHHGFPLPLALLPHITPKFNAIRHPGRMHPMLMYLALFASGYVLAWLSRKWNKRWAPRLAARLTVASALALNLLWSAKFVHFPRYHTVQPLPFLQSIAAPLPHAGDPLPGAVLDLPASNYWFSHYNYLQLTHRRPLVWALGGFFHDAVRRESVHFMTEDPQLRFFLVEQNAGPPVWNDETLAGIAGEAFMRKLAAEGIEYVIIHPREVDFVVNKKIAPANSPEYYARIEAGWAAHLVYQDDALLAYRTGDLPR